MPPLDFPNAPSLNQLFAGPNNVQWQWDGSKWLGTPNTLGPIIVAASPPTFVSGQLWWDSTGGNLYLGYDDGNTQQWVPASNIAGLANAATTMDVDKALNDVGRNLIHNATMTIAQRGAGPWTSGYTADRWSISSVGAGAAMTATIVALVDADRAAIGDESASSALNNSFIGTAAAGDFSFCAYQPIENIRRLAGKTVIVSFWAKANAGTPKIGFSLYQYFGTGGSPSAGINGIGPQTFTLSSTWARYTTTAITLPSIAGKTLGTNNDHQTQVIFCGSSGATNNVAFGSPGVQSYVLQLWGIQLEVVQPGQTVPSKLEKRDPVLELQQCQRFYQVGEVLFTGYQAAASNFAMTYMLPVPLRASATPVFTPLGNTNIGTITFGIQSPRVANFQGVTAAAGSVQIYGNFTISADL